MIKLAYLILDLSAELRRCRRTVEDDERDDAIAVRDAVMCDECDLPYRDRNRYSCWSQGGGHRYNQQELREALGRFA
jgi:hypothetical protein